MPGNTLTPHIVRYLAEKQRRGLAPGTVRSMRVTLNQLDRSFGNRRLAMFGPAAVDTWLDTLSGKAKGTRRVKLSHVRGFCRWGQRHKLWKNDPCRDVEPIGLPRSVPRAFTADEVAAAFAAAPDARARAVLHLMLGCGLRACEVASAEVGDWDRDAGLLRVVGKGQHERYVAVHPEAAAAVDAYLRSTGVVGGPMIRSEDGVTGLKAATIVIYVGRWLYDAGVKKAARDGKSGHCFRHTAISDVLENADYDLRVAQEFAGHVSLATTQIYLRRAGLQRQAQAQSRRTYSTPLDAA